MRAVARAAAALAANPELKTITQVMRAARCSSGIAYRAIVAQTAAQDEAAELLRRQLANGPKRAEFIEAAAEVAEMDEPVLVAAADALGVRTHRGQWKLRAEAAKPVQSPGKRARALVRDQLRHGPGRAAQVEAAAQAAEIPKHVLLDVTDALGVRTRRGSGGCRVDPRGPPVSRLQNSTQSPWSDSMSAWRITGSITLVFCGLFSMFYFSSLEAKEPFATNAQILRAIAPGLIVAVVGLGQSVWSKSVGWLSAGSVVLILGGGWWILLMASMGVMVFDSLSATGGTYLKQVIPLATPGLIAVVVGIGQLIWTKPPRFPGTR